MLDRSGWPKCCHARADARSNHPTPSMPMPTPCPCVCPWPRPSTPTRRMPNVCRVMLFHVMLWPVDSHAPHAKSCAASDQVARTPCPSTKRVSGITSPVASDVPFFSRCRRPPGYPEEYFNRLVRRLAIPSSLIHMMIARLAHPSCYPSQSADEMLSPYLVSGQGRR